jgi:protein-disulfide isomerase
MEERKSNTSKLTFALGLVSGVAVISLIGFMVLLTKGGVSKAPANGESGNQPTAAGGGNDNAPQKEVVIKEVTKDDHIRGGSIDAPVKIVEYSDLECPFCKKHHDTMIQIVADYGDKVAWVYRHFPLSYGPQPLHSKAAKEAEATECAAELAGNDGFWKMTDKIFEVSPTNNGLNLDTLPDLAAEVGLNREKFTECLDSGKYAEKVKASYDEAGKAGAQGTPYNVIIGPDGGKTPLPGAYPVESFKEVIDQMLTKK